ncbi:flagellar biosynthesis protein FlhF [Colwellia sp. BRX10-3]|uniref:flagellar biosynthesis protein FlhF n=1 Tax=Colwellia sp. BRX10-3 TaxID=2759844 RepID=UPI0015F5F228|nr:flagellar biosynthesis protein FlhF [Colwellia sp. BRX10-3]MBA6389438.1 flagellar biosynthesis protein FlhF [Colwellia sp. BRX10-3]
MKIRRYVAKDMRTALAQIKEELGVDAVIMSNKKIAEGVELMAAVDYNQSVKPAKSSGSDHKQHNADANNQPANRVDSVEDTVAINGSPKSMSQTADKSVQQSTTVPADSLAALLSRQVQQNGYDKAPATRAFNSQIENSTPKENHQGSAKRGAAPQDIEQQFKNFTTRLEQTTSIESPEDGFNQKSEAAGSELNNSNFNNAIEQSIAGADKMSSHGDRQINSSEFDHMQKEMSSIRQLLEHQMSGLMWQDMAQKDPMRAVLVNKLMAMGLNEQVADQIAGYIPANTHEQDAWQQAKHIIAQQLNTTNNDIIQRGGVVSLVGPTGVGKTTTIAKLAARFAQIHGADQVVLISTDSYRIAGFEQLATYGRIIGCQVKLANDANELDNLLQQFAQKKLILIDTAGMGQRDMRLTEHLTTLIANARVRIRNYLVLAANTQQRVMQENVERFKKIPLAGCIYTKLDESLSVGEIITTSLQNGLAIGYLTDGQRVPEDIKVANAEKLVTLADRMAIKYQSSGAVSWRAPVAV